MKLLPDAVTERVFYTSGVPEVDFEIRATEDGELTNFCIDKTGKVRIALGIVNMIPAQEDNESFVPMHRYGISPSPWNSHADYVVLELPNPVTEPGLFYIIRCAMLTEFERRLRRQIKNTKARLRKEVK